MTLTQLINQPVVILARSESGDTDDYGNDVPSEDAIETLGYVEQRRRTEDEDSGEVSESDWLGIFLEEDTAFLDTASAVWVPGLGEFELVGAPWPAYNPRTQVTSHVEATMRRTAGSEDSVGS